MSYKTKFSILIIVFLLLDFGLIFFARNLFFEIKKISSEINKKKEEIILLEKKAQAFEEFSEILKTKGKEIEKIESFFIDPTMPIDFINFLEKNAKELNLALKFSISQTKGKNLWPFLTFQINLAGHPSNVLKFLDKLYFSNYLIEIQNLDISKVEKEEIPKVEANFSIKVYSK
jgi:hypothetical protein